MKTIYKMREKFMDTTMSKVLIHFLKAFYKFLSRMML